MDLKLLNPESLTEALSFLGEYASEAKLLAGGQSLLILLQHRLLSPQYIINIKGLKELEYIRADDEGLKIGALTTHRAVEKSDLINSDYPMLVEMQQTLADVQVRNWGSIGGGLCHADPAGDAAPALIALGAKVKLASTRGEREMDLEDFNIGYYETVLEPDEILVEIIVPPVKKLTGAAFYKESMRRGDLAIAGTGISVSLDRKGKVNDVRIVLSAVGATAIRAKEAEKLLIGKKPEGGLIEETASIAATNADPTEDIHASADYKKEIIKVICRDTLKKAISRAAGK